MAEVTIFDVQGGKEESDAQSRGDGWEGKQGYGEYPGGGDEAEVDKENGKDGGGDDGVDQAYRHAGGGDDQAREVYFRNQAFVVDK